MPEISRWTMPDDASRSGRPVEVDSDQVETLIEYSQCYTVWEIANILKISKSIKLSVKVKSVSFMYRLFDQPNTILSNL